MSEEKNWRGQAVDEIESDDDKITIWEISPHPTHPRSFDGCWVRGYQNAKALAQQAIESIMDDPENEDELRTEGMSVSIRLRKVTKQEYEDSKDE